MFAAGILAAICFRFLRALTSWPTWLQVLVAAVGGFLGLLGVALLPAGWLFGDEATMFESRPLLGASARRKSDRQSDDGGHDEPGN